MTQGSGLHSLSTGGQFCRAGQHGAFGASQHASGLAALAFSRQLHLLGSIG